MSLDEMPSVKTMQGQINMDAMKHKTAKGCYLSMGQTSENVAAKFNIFQEKHKIILHMNHKLELRKHKIQVNLKKRLYQFQQP